MALKIELTGTHILPPDCEHSLFGCKEVKCSHELFWFFRAITFELAITHLGALLLKHYRAVAHGAIRKRVSRHVNYLVFIATIHEIRCFDSLPFEYRSL